MASRMIELKFRTILLVAALLIYGCGSAQLVSEQSVDEKVDKIKLGRTTMAEVEELFGPDHGKDARFWVYNLTDTAMEIAAPKSAVLQGMMPLVPMSAATNTRALISVQFAQSGVVKQLEVARYFEMPFRRDYWFLVKQAPANVIASIALAGEASGLKVSALNPSAGTLDLQDIGTKAQINVTVEKQILHLTSINPHDRQSNEYRLFTKRESVFAEKISDEFLQ